ncbi:MAG TPA: hypothetical protein PLS49_03280 [Candidatus Woesebacteria bacterium]|nr:hypothetical protein [Candidatus Woesebacteria bacterium]
MKKKITPRSIVVIILSVSVLLTFSYNAFSHDIFNYIFDAKIVTMYHDNPYVQKALDYPQDPMLSFMQWTHRTYPYGPVWIFLSVPVSFIGMQVFFVTFYLFKVFTAAAYLGTVWFMYKTVQKQKKEFAVFAAAFFALNPLILIEFLVSGHNDIVMIFFSTLAMYLAMQRKIIGSGISYLLSVGVKYATGFLAPVMVILYLKPKYFERAMYAGIVLMIGAVIAASLKSGNFQPWYIAYVIGVATLVSYRKYVSIPIGIFTFFACMHYVPYLYTGTWDAPVPEILLKGLLLASVCSAVALVYYLFLSFAKKSKV